jgi:hypothetical protein
VVGALATGPLLSAFGPRGTTLAMAAATMGMALITLPRLRTLERTEMGEDDAMPALVAAAT